MKKKNRPPTPKTLLGPYFSSSSFIHFFFLSSPCSPRLRAKFSIFLLFSVPLCFCGKIPYFPNFLNLLRISVQKFQFLSIILLFIQVFFLSWLLLLLLFLLQYGL